MDDKDFSNLGDQIRGMVQQAIDSMDFGELSRNMNDTANKALHEARKHMNINPRREENLSHEVPAPKPKPELPVVNKSLPGKTAGILYTVFGGLGLGVSLALMVVVVILSTLFHASLGVIVGVLVFFLLLFGGSATMLGIGSSMRQRLKRLSIYAASLKGRAYCNIQELADKTGRSRKYVAKDLRRMIQLGMFSEAYLDDKETCVILGKDAYHQYRQAEEAYHQRTKAVDMRPEADGDEKISSPYEEAVRIGEGYLKELREANDVIPGQAISVKLDRLEHVVERIFDSVKKHPKQLDEMEKFMDYYLPTTVKLVNAYREFDSVDLQGENIKNAKAEIEQTLDTINHAFERFFDDLYQDAAFDVSSDASVLQTILERDGWTGSDFK